MTKTVEELQAELDAALESVAKLDAKNKETIREKQRIADEAKAAREAAEEAAAEAALKSGDVEAIKAAHAKDLKKLQDALKATEANLSKTLIDNSIQATMTELQIPAHFQAALMHMFKADAKIENGVAKIGDDLLVDHIKNFAKTDAGKHFVPAPVNSGGGAPGSKSTVNASVMAKFDLDQWFEIKETDPALAETLAHKFNMSHLLATK